MYSVEDIYFSTKSPMYKCDKRGKVISKLTKSEIKALEDTEILRIEPFIHDQKAALKIVIGRRHTSHRRNY